MVRVGSHRSKALGRVQRYRCQHCGRTFSDQTFSIDYYAKKLVDYGAIFGQLVTGSGLMDTARALHTRPETVQNRIERLARCAIAIHADLLARVPMTENLAADGFASFSFSQYFPNTLDHFTGSESEFIYAAGLSTLRRSGRMTAKQRSRRDELERAGKADPQATRRSFQELGTSICQLLKIKGVEGITLFTDQHQAYPRAFRQIAGFDERIRHVTISSRRSRTRKNPLFPVNYVDRQLRKDLSDHCRETVQFARCPSAMMARFLVYRHYHNCVIHRRLREYRKGDKGSHAEKAGIPRPDIQRCIDRHWLKRVFFGRVKPSSAEAKTWFCRWRNPGFKPNRYEPKYLAA